MELEIKHLAGYLPYGLKVYAKYFHDKGIENKLTSIDIYGFCDVTNFQGVVCVSDIKPIMRLLSDLTLPQFTEMIKEWYKATAENEISIISRTDSSGSCTVMVCYKIMGEPFTDYIFSRNSVENTPYWIVEKLLENHFDIHGLIEQNLAINMNTLNEEL